MPVATAICTRWPSAPPRIDIDVEIGVFRGRVGPGKHRPMRRIYDVEEHDAMGDLRPMWGVTPPERKVREYPAVDDHQRYREFAQQLVELQHKLFLYSPNDAEATTVFRTTRYHHSHPIQVHAMFRSASRFAPPSALLLLVLLSAAASQRVAAAEPLSSGELALTLEGGICAVDKVGQSRLQRIELEFTGAATAAGTPGSGGRPCSSTRGMRSARPTTSRKPKAGLCRLRSKTAKSGWTCASECRGTSGARPSWRPITLWSWCGAATTTRGATPAGATAER